MKKIIITRKIQLNVDLEPGTDLMKAAWERLYAIQNITFRAANLVSTHNFLQEKMKDMIYLTDETKVKLSDITKDEEGILNTSKLNTTYKILSKEFKGKIPTSILTCINAVVTQSYNAEKKDYFSGKKSLRNYRRDLPIPFQKSAIRNFRLDKGTNNYHFELFNIPFKTYLGLDKSNNRHIIECIMNEEYEMGDSSIQLKKGKIFFLMVVKFDKIQTKLDKEKVLIASLDFEHPIIAKLKKKEFIIGSNEEYVHRRLQIQNAFHRAQRVAKYNKGGKGRNKKMKSIIKYHEIEKNFVNTKMHQYSHELIRIALQQKTGTIKLINIPISDDLKEDNPFLLRNWSYFGLIEKIKYKASKFGIEVVEE